MQKIQKFQIGHIYFGPKRAKTYELIERNNHYLIFRVRKSKDSTTSKTSAVSTYKADQNGAFEEVLFADGICLRSIQAA